MRILIADDHKFILDSLEMLISTMPEHEVTGTYISGVEVLSALEKNSNIDAILSDYNMGELNGIEMTRQIKQKFPHIKVLLLTVSEDAETIKEAFEAGVSGYVMKKAGKAELQKALSTIASGEKYYSESVVFELLNRDKKIGDLVDESNTTGLLTERELEIIRLIAQELSTNQIAEKLFISPATVETHRHNILKKLGVKNSIGIVMYAVNNKIV
ncbi:response regulator transcription factor [Emticicia sp. BO119]|uniref:response regulator n=1 Tax=Emticicia sp. BO119 TaxID=2757768 RepID=UPI0015F03B68|nr:response regulator transcription factor [Emticicia sp. BO119]MBA4853735.1 response regulator transcription factor [Emticicia sp. BO119]